MSGLNGDQLEALRDRVEDDYRRLEEEYRRAEQDYRLDVAAIEHLQRRFFGGVSRIPTSDHSQTSTASNGGSSTIGSDGELAAIVSDSESPATTLPPQYTPTRLQCDGLEDSLRSMFTTSHV